MSNFFSDAPYSPSPSTIQNLSMVAFALTPQARLGIRAWRYYDSTIYDPQFSMQFSTPFAEWDENTQGKRPVCMPLAKKIVETSAQFLFSSPPKFTIGKKNDPANLLQAELDKILTQNKISKKYLPEARACAIEGQTHFKFAWTPQITNRPVAIMTHSASDVTYFRNPLDQDVIMMARLQFKYCDNSGQWWIYREEWTDDEFRIYKTLATKINSDSEAISNLKGVWPSTASINPFGLIPFVCINNREIKGAQAGVGDFWEIFALLDQINHDFYLEHHSDQLDGNPTTIFLNSTYDGSVLPGSIINLQGEGADAKRLSAGNENRPNLRLSKQDLIEQAWNAVGYDNPDTSDITNKGALTQDVFQMVFTKSIKTTKEKQLHWGEGLTEFYGKMLLGLSRLTDARAMFPGLSKINSVDTSTYTPTCSWSDLFELVGTRTDTLSDLNTSLNMGLITLERAALIGAEIWGIEDTTELLEELKSEQDKQSLIAPSPAPASAAPVDDAQV